MALKKFEVDCPICSKHYDQVEFPECPCCAWEYQGHEDIMTEDERCPYHLISMRTAKERFSNGMDIWGNPLH